MQAARSISSLTPALKALNAFPDGAREVLIDALSIAAERGKAGIAKPMKGLGSGIFEIALLYQG